MATAAHDHLDIEKRMSAEYIDDVEHEKNLAAAAHSTGHDGVEVHMPASLKAMSPEELHALNKKATRKLDLVLMPTLIFLYLLNFLDRNNISTAKLGGITKTLNMPHAQQFSTAVAILFAGYSEYLVYSEGCPFARSAGARRWNVTFAPEKRGMIWTK